MTVATPQDPGSSLIPAHVGLPEAWDPFQLMDRLDEEALRKELEGIASTELCYVIKEGGQEVVGLSKVGVDECCMILVSQGMVIREESLEYEIIGEGENREALFKVKAARFAVRPDGGEVRLDQVIGVKRQSLYYEPQVLDLDAKAPSKKYKGKTYRDLLGFDEGRDYLAWMAENFSEPAIREFVRKILNGEAVQASRERQLNPHWYEAGAMKAARNARFRLIPADTRALVIARARQNGLTTTVDRSRSNGHQSAPRTDRTEQLRQQEDARQRAQAPTPTAHADPSASAPAPQPVATGDNAARLGAFAPTDKQVAFYQRLAESPGFTEEERRRALEWLATRATKQTIKDQIDHLKRAIDTRRAAQ